MTFEKPKDVRYVDMAIYIDEHAYLEDADDNIIYEYLYHLINMLAHKRNFFKSVKYYDEFAIRTATRVYYRLKNPAQFELDENGQPKMKKIKSVLNYIKNILYPAKVDYEQEEYAQVTNYGLDDEAANDEIMKFREMLVESVDALNKLEFTLCLGDCTKTVKAFLKTIPYKYGSVKWTNIYISCLLSFLNSVTLSNQNLEKINSYSDEQISNRLDALDKAYIEENSDYVILWHLDGSMYNYIFTLVKKIKHLIARDLSLSLDTYIPSENSMKNIMLNNIQEE